MTAPSDLNLTAFLRFFSPLDPKSQEPIPWLKDRSRVKALVEGILSSPLFAGIAIGRAGDEDFRAVTPAEAGTLVATGDQILARFLDRETDRISDELFIELDLRDSRSEVQLSACGGAITKLGDRALDEMIAVLQKCVQALKGVTGLSDGHIQAHFGDRSFDFARPRPPRRSHRYPENAIVTFLDPAFYATGVDFGKSEEMKALIESVPPPPAQRSEKDGLVTIRWTSSCEETDLLAGASAQAQWIVDRIAPDIERGYNELGDQLEDRSAESKKRGKLTFYDPESEVGYKAVLVMPDGSYEKSAWNDALKIAKAGKLPDGAKVSGLRIIVPLREHVFAVADQAKAAGFDAVLYSDEKGNFWDPNPPGEWRTPPIGGKT